MLHSHLIAFSVPYPPSATVSVQGPIRRGCGCTVQHSTEGARFGEYIHILHSHLIAFSVPYPPSTTQHVPKGQFDKAVGVLSSTAQRVHVLVNIFTIHSFVLQILYSHQIAFSIPYPPSTTQSASQGPVSWGSGFSVQHGTEGA